jgi:hypothetical protein
VRVHVLIRTVVGLLAKHRANRALNHRLPPRPPSPDESSRYVALINSKDACVASRNPSPFAMVQTAVARRSDEGGRACLLGDENPNQRCGTGTGLRSCTH